MNEISLPTRVSAAPDQNVEFAGRGGEYFRIWIVNIALSVVTLGIYSAWAKVRNKRYFYASTTLAGASFDYTADPIKILKGRIIVVGFFIIYSAAGRFLPPVGALLGLLLIFLIPWAANRSLAFNARYSSYRNLAFRFKGDYGESFLVFIVLPVGSLFTLGILYPYAVYQRKKYIVERHHYGTTPFGFEGRPGAFFRIYFTALAVMLLALAAVGLLSTALAAALAGSGAAGAFRNVAPAVFFALFPLIALLTLIYLQIAVANYVWRHTTLRDNRFDLNLEYRPMLWIQLSNLIGIVLTLGIWIPFAKVRIARYRLERLALLAATGLDAFVAGEREALSATGEELGEAFDLDLGL